MEVVDELGQAEVSHVQGIAATVAIRYLGDNEATLGRWTNEHGVMSGDQLRFLKKGLANQNKRLRQAVFDLRLEKQILAEAAPGGTSEPFPALPVHRACPQLARALGPRGLLPQALPSFPLTARLCRNGQEYAKRQLRRRGIEFETPDNSIRGGADPAACRRFATSSAPRTSMPWCASSCLACLIPFEAVDRQPGYRFGVSILQAEMSLTQVFDRPLQGHQFFEEVIRENVHRGRPEFKQLAFGCRVNSRTPSRFHTRLLTAGVEPSLRNLERERLT